MKKIIQILTACMLCSLSLQAQVDTKGTDFWLTFGENTIGTDSSIDMQLRIVGGSQASTVTIYFTDLGISKPFSVGANQVYTDTLTLTEKRAVYNSIHTGISNRSIHITATEPITVYALNQLLYSTDATNVLPIWAATASLH
jgi:hypothetical protein